MCGINGFNWNDKAKIACMNSVIKHRGPDDEGVLTGDSVSLGHVRLSILDLTSAGHQPMSNEDETLWITCNGEIYNCYELRKDLLRKGHIFKSMTDTEVIIHAYEEYGIECVDKFNGMWAFCIFDKTKNVLFLSRDRFGIKPLYYYFDGERFVFSSEISGILQHGIKIEPNNDVVFDFLYYNLTDHTEDTFFKSIKRLIPSNNLVFNLESKTVQLQRYYDLERKIGTERNDIQKTRDLFRDAVQKTLLSDVPVGSCLSGGIDSSAIVLAMEAMKKRESYTLNGSKIKTFSLTFPGQLVDESRYQQEIRTLIDSDHYFTSPYPGDLISDIYDLIHTQEEPFTGTSVYGQYRVMKLARENNIKVLLDGQGADEILAGYHYFLGFYYYELLRNLKVLKLMKEVKEYLSKSGSFLPVLFLFMRVLPVFLKKLLYIHYKNTFLSQDFVKDHKHRIDIRWNISTLNEALVKSVLIYSLPHLLRFEDKNSMRFSIESRVPFLDYRFVEYALSTPADYKIHKGVTKYGFRKANKSVLPTSILCRFDKIGFSTPEEDWLKNEKVKKFVMSVINSESFKSREYWDWSKVKETYKRTLAGKSPKWFVGTDIWRCVSVELWMRIFIDDATN